MYGKSGKPRRRPRLRWADSIEVMNRQNGRRKRFLRTIDSGVYGPGKRIQSCTFPCHNELTSGQAVAFVRMGISKDHLCD